MPTAREDVYWGSLHSERFRGVFRDEPTVELVGPSAAVSHFLHHAERLSVYLIAKYLKRKPREPDKKPSQARAL